MSAADWLSVGRLFLVAMLWPAAIAGQERLIGLGLIVAALTDVLDGYVARRIRRTSVRGARLDAIADSALMISVAVWLTLLHPHLVADNVVLLTVTGVLYIASGTGSWFAFGRLVNPRQLSAKAAGGLLYAFALFTFLSGVYEPLLLTVALAALGIASLEAVVAASTTIHARGIASSARSHRPQASNDVRSSARASASIASSATPTARQIGPL
jgi:CDP-diacylglycerol---glycerol-3-phosphate 3-phosphatidyltransferase